MCKLERVPVLFEWDRLSSATLTHSSFLGTTGLLMLRLFCFLYTTAVMGVSLWIYPNSKLEWMAWLTNWCQVATVGYFLCSLFFTFTKSGKEPKVLSESSSVERGCYLLFELAFSWNVLAGLMYWFTVFPSQPGVAHIEMLVKINVHFVNVVLLLAECSTNAIEFIPVHLMVVLGLLYVYATANACYTSISYELFSILKWQTFGSVGVLIAITVFLIAAFYMGYGLNLIRQVLIVHFKLPSTPQPKEEDEETKQLLKA